MGYVKHSEADSAHDLMLTNINFHANMSRIWIATLEDNSKHLSLGSKQSLNVSLSELCHSLLYCALYCISMAEGNCEWMTTGSQSVHALVRGILPASKSWATKNFSWVPLNQVVCIYAFCHFILHLSCVILVKIMSEVLDISSGCRHMCNSKKWQAWVAKRENFDYAYLSCFTKLHGNQSYQNLLNCVEMVVLIQWPC